MNDTIKSANFDSIVSHDPVTGLPVYDRPLRGEDVREMYKMIVSDGIYPNPSTSFQVMEGENDNEVIVKAGFGWVQGCPVWDLSDEVVELDPANENNPRIDLVVLQWNNLLANRWVQKVVITGTASATPSAPALTRTADVYEICLAEIERPAGSSLVIQSEITDTRGDDDLCGWTHGVVDQVDTSTIFNQYASWLQDIQDQWEAWWETQQETTGYLTTGGDYTTLKTFDKKVIHAINEVNDGSIALGRAHSGDGILSGCEMAISGSTLVIQPGEIIAGGKPVIFTSTVAVDLSGVSISNGFVQVVLNIKASLNPAFWFTTVESGTTTFPDLTQDSLLVLGNLYQLQLAVVQISGGNLTGITSYLSYSPVLVMNENGDALRMYYLNDGTFRIGSFDSVGSSKEGMSTNGNGNLILFANGQNILIRPLGISGSENQISYRTDGSVGYPNIVGTTIEKAISGSIKATVSYNKRGNVVTGVISAGTGSALSSFASGVNLGTLDSGFRPEYTLSFPISARTSGAWASATYYPLILQITSAGTVILLGNQANIRTCQYIGGCFSFGTA